MANYKAIVIDAKEKSVPNGVEAKWADVTTHMPILTRDIKTPALDAGSDLTAVVSGMPSIFARANLFKLAIVYVEKRPNAADNEPLGLLNYYSNLVDEWRGLIACIAHDYSRISVRRITLGYSDGKSIEETENIYEPKGAFGNALFERKELWTRQVEGENIGEKPFIDVIEYDGQVVGATSPDSFFFTAPGYHINHDLPFVSKRTHKFTDPLHSAPDQDLTLTLLAYVEHLEDHVSNLTAYFKNLPENKRPDYQAMKTNLSHWKEEIKAYCVKNGFDMEAKSIPPVKLFSEPYNLIFNYSANLYGLEGIIYGEDDEAPANKILFDPKDILLPKNSEIAQIDFSNSEIRKNPALLEEQPLYVLKAQVVGKVNEWAYFALPISALGLNVFGKNIGALTGIDSRRSINSKLTAVYDPHAKTNNLEVTLELITISGKRRTLKESYTVKRDRISNKDILIWPNFISEKWNRYFMYSEMPHNAVSQGCPFKATPIVGYSEGSDFRILTNRDNNEPLLLAKDGNIEVDDVTRRDFGLDAKLHIVSDIRVSDNDYKYEIFESSLPFKGVKLTSGGRDSGYLVIRYTSGNDKNLPKNEIDLARNFVDANVGIDFGSTNTSVAYAVGDEKPKGITFHNHRISLLQAGNPSSCRERDLFFFQSKELAGNSVKSILTIHDPRRFARDNSMPGNYKAEVAPENFKEVSGGFPCFDPSLLPVENVSENRIVLKCPEIGQVQLVHDMKWSDHPIDKAFKTAFLRSLMLHVYAELYSEGCIPTKIKWSYPSAMGADLISQYNGIWDGLQHQLSPIKGKDLKVSRASGSITVADEGAFGPKGEATGFEGFDEGFPSDAGGFAAPAADGFGPAAPATADAWGAPANGWGAPEAPKAADGWGQLAAPTSGAGWGTPQATSAEEDLAPDTNEVEFNFAEINPTESMTESSAVANFLSDKGVGADINSLSLCFDVGGTTTDISAVLSLENRITLIKQNSIRFAARQVAQAAKYEPNLKSVLLEICRINRIVIPGLNVGRDMYKPETASYYFEQVLDRLPEESLPSLYQNLNANCHKMMAVNLYVTGLIIFYAGQLTGKLINVIRTSLGKNNPFYARFTPPIKILFAGKGSRVFEWFYTSQPENANKYYQQMFIKGIGGMDVAKTLLYGPPQINLSRSDVKYEVSKGLAWPPMRGIRVPERTMEAIEIIGEDNFCIIKNSTYEQVPLQFDNAITPKMMEKIGQNFVLSQQTGGQLAAARFNAFAYLYYQYATALFKLPLTTQQFVDGISNMNIVSYVTSRPEYRHAMQKKNAKPDEKFDFVAPIIILEGMKFYEEFLLKNL